MGPRCGAADSFAGRRVGEPRHRHPVRHLARRHHRLAGGGRHDPAHRHAVLLRWGRRRRSRRQGRPRQLSVRHARRGRRRARFASLPEAHRRAVDPPVLPGPARSLRGLAADPQRESRRGLRPAQTGAHRAALRRGTAGADARPDPAADPPGRGRPGRYRQPRLDGDDVRRPLPTAVRSRGRQRR
jgi:hypothetical protein